MDSSLLYLILWPSWQTALPNPAMCVSANSIISYLYLLKVHIVSSIFPHAYRFLTFYINFKLANQSHYYCTQPGVHKVTTWSLLFWTSTDLAWLCFSLVSFAFLWDFYLAVVISSLNIVISLLAYHYKVKDISLLHMEMGLACVDMEHQQVTDVHLFPFQTSWSSHCWPQCKVYQHLTGKIEKIRILFLNESHDTQCSIFQLKGKDLWYVRVT